MDMIDVGVQGDRLAHLSRFCGDVYKRRRPAVLWIDDSARAYSQTLTGKANPLNVGYLEKSLTNESQLFWIQRQSVAARDNDIV